MNRYLEKIAEQSEENSPVARGASLGGWAGTATALYHDVRDIRSGEPLNFKKSLLRGLGHNLAGAAVGAGAGAAYQHFHKQAEQTYSMPLKDAISEHEKLTRVLRSNNRKAELEELKDQGSELKEMKADARS